MEILLYITIWIAAGIIGATGMALGVNEPVRRFVPFSIVFAPAALIMGIVWFLIGLGEEL